MTSQRIEQLVDVFQTYPLQKKILITRSFSQGHQWFDQVCLNSGKVLNASVETIESLVLLSSQVALRKQEVRYLHSAETFWLVHQLMAEMAELSNAYVSNVMLSPGVVHRFHQAITELRYAQITSDRLDANDFEKKQKGQYMQQLLSKYEQALHQQKATDFAGLLPYIEPMYPSIQPIYIVDEQLQLSVIEENMLNKITKGEFLPLISDLSFTDTVSSFPYQFTGFFHANGALSEIREVFRRIARLDIALDQVEIIASDYSQYAPIMYSFSQTVSLSCTFSKGLPMDFTNAGKAAKLYLQWVDTNFPIDTLTKGLKQRLIRIPQSDNREKMTASKIIWELEQSGIGWGRERYEIMDKHPVFSSFFEALFQPLSKTEWHPNSLLSSLISFLEQFAIVKDEQDQIVIAEMKASLPLMHFDASISMSKSQVMAYVKDVLEQITCHVQSQPQSGKIHLTSLQDGGQSGRKFTFLIGMNEKIWTPSSQQDPVLLDEERMRINEHLPTSAQKTELRMRERNGRLSMITQTCTVSFLSYDLTEQKERSPAFEMLQIFRNNRNDSTADMEALIKQIGPRIGFFPTGTSAEKEIIIDEMDGWIHSLVDEKGSIKNAEAGIFHAYPHLQQGKKAKEMRKLPRISIYDGMPQPEIPEEIDIALSVSKMEQFARCSLQFYFKEVLQIRPKEVVRFDRTRWLDALQRGSLLHRIYERYWNQMILLRKENATAEHQFDKLQEISNQAIQEMRVEVPPPSEHVYQKEKDSLMQDVNIFFQVENSKQGNPLFLEYALHTEEEMFNVEFGEELSLPLRGYVDRVDQIGPNQYKIFDYKTGSHRGYQQNEYFAKGKQLQHAIYALAVEQKLKIDGVDPEASVTESAYYFPTMKGMGEEVTRTQNNREALEALVRSMLQAIRTGVFPPTDDEKVCGFCDYQEVCGNHARFMKEKWQHADNEEQLSSVLEVRKYD